MKEMMSNVPAIPKLESLPKELAERYVARTWIEGAEMVHDGDKSRIYRIFERKAMIPGVGEGKLRLDARHWHEPDQALHRDQIRFEYVAPGEKGDRLVAEMHLNEPEEDAFWLQHRYVQPEYRGRKGIGSALLQQVEDWLRQVGEVHGRDVRLGLTAGQIDVFRWLQKQKFWIRKKEKPLLDEILQHPENFVIESATDDPNITQDLYVFEKGKKGRTREDSVRLRFEKRIATGLPSQKTDNIMKHFVPSWDERSVEAVVEKEPSSVRTATVADAADIARIQIASWRAVYPNEDLNISTEDIEEHFGSLESNIFHRKRQLTRAGSHEKTLLLQLGDKTIGYCCVARNKDYGNVGELYLDPEYTGEKRADRLLLEGMRWLDPLLPMELDVAEHNERAIRFYERFGFRIQGNDQPLGIYTSAGWKEIPMITMVRDQAEGL